MTEAGNVFEARDGVRTLQFEGDLLAESSSQKRGAMRWVEFRLYKTRGGSYILSRIGRSLVVHSPECSLVRQYNLKRGTPEVGSVRCEQCSPDDPNELYPEKQRYWAQVMEHPEAVLEALYKWDSEGAKYLTLVAQRLLGDAAKNDDGIARVYNTEYVY